MSQSEEEKRLLAEATQKARAELREKEARESTQWMGEEDLQVLHKIENPLEHIAFAPVWFANFSLPHSDRHYTPEGPIKQPKRELILINGNKELTLYSRAGLPSGVIARKFLFWITTEALKRKHLPVEVACYIPVKSLRAILKDMDITASGGKNGTLSALQTQMRRVVRMSYYEDSIHSKEIDEAENSNVAKRAFFKWETNSADEVELNQGSQIVLDKDFFLEIADNGAVPLDKRILAKLSRSPLAIDLYVWLTYRLSYQTSPGRVTFRQLHKQFATGYPDTERGYRNFKTKIQTTFTKVCIAWKEVTGKYPGAKRTGDGILLYPRTEPSVPHRVISQASQMSEAFRPAPNDPVF